ncbi:MAG: hypothetical protein ACI376_08760, partial [Candidatus Bruticola sp.]
KAEAQGSASADKAEAQKSASADKAEAQGSASADKAEAQGSASADKAEAQGSASADKAEAQKSGSADKAKAQESVSADKAEVQESAPADKAEAQGSASADKAEAQGSASADKAEAQESVSAEKAEAQKSAPAEKVQTASSSKCKERSTSSVVGMAAAAVLLMAAIGYWGYFITPELGKDAQPPRVVGARTDTTASYSTDTGGPAGPKRQDPTPPVPPSAASGQVAPITEEQNKVTISDLEMAILTPPIYRKVDNPIVQRDITVSQYMYARDYLSFSGSDSSAIDEFDSKAQKLANSGNDPDGKEQDKLVKQAEETAVSLLKNYFTPKLSSSKVKNKEKLAAEADQYFAMGDISNGVRTYETACGLEKKVYNDQVSR